MCYGWGAAVQFGSNVWVGGRGWAGIGLELQLGCTGA